MGTSLILAAIGFHVAMGASWLLATLAVAVTRLARPAWLKLMLVAGLLNMTAGIYLWHALHSGPWGPTEHLLVLGTFCAFLALGLQAPIAFTQAPDLRRLAGPSLAVLRVTAVVLLAAAAAMVGSGYA